jgi:hypothetical protein
MCIGYEGIDDLVASHNVAIGTSLRSRHRNILSVIGQEQTLTWLTGLD